MTTYRGTIINPLSDRSFQVYAPGYLSFDQSGCIQSINDKPPKEKTSTIDVGDHLILPGLIDTHTHLPQYPISGLSDLPLLPWLDKYTFPQEARFADTKIARLEAENFFSQCLSFGTTTVVAYVTSHEDATNIAFEAAQRAGVRAFLGLVLMDENAPKVLTTSVADAQKSCQTLIATWQKKDHLQFVVSPRFAVSCSEEMLRLAGDLSKDYDLLLQTHLSENFDEIEVVRKRFAWAQSYTDVYRQTGCLREKSLLGHALHLAESEIELVKENNSVLVHCPTSNRFLGSGVMPLRKFENQGIRLSLGTDVAAGYSLSMFDEMKEACETSKTYNIFHDHKEKSLTAAEALYYATLGAASALGISEETGNFAAGKQADFIIVDDHSTHPLSGLHDQVGEKLYSNYEERLLRLLYRAHPQMVVASLVAGKKLYDRDQSTGLRNSQSGR